MKKILLYLFTTLLALSFGACSDDDDNGGDENDKKKLNISVFYNMKDSEYEYLDQGAKIYILSGTGFANTDAYEYRGEGKFYHLNVGDWKQPLQTLTNGQSEILEAKCDYDCTVVVESAYYEGSYLIKEKLLKDDNRDLKFVFPVVE